MRIFEKPNLDNDWKCPICKTNKEKKVVLIGINGTQKDNLIEAEQFHLQCLQPIYDKDLKMILQIVKI